MRNRVAVKPRRRWLRRTLIACALLAPVVFCAFWLTLHHIPKWYDPVYVPEARLDDVRAEAANTYNAISEGIIRGREFDLVLDERRVTEWVSAGNRIWPGAANLIPGWLEDPVVTFRDGRIILGARVHKNDHEMIAGVHLTLDVTDDEMVVLRMARLTGGSLPVPARWLGAPISSLLRMDNQDADLLPTPVADLVRKFRESEPLKLLSEGIPRANRFIWENGRRPFRIAAVHSDSGMLTLTIDPL